jgi:BirA family biotin operon repressor/biotin-[acetyl-CoA-carboxylase] ligase
VVVESGVPPRRRKLAGVLAEGSSGADGLQYVILGFGINLRPAAYPPELANLATSIETELGRPPDDGAVLAETLVALASLFRRLVAGEAYTVLARWRALAPSAQGTAVQWDTPAGSRSGTAAGIADDGALLVKVAGRIERVISGELRWS